MALIVRPAARPLGRGLILGGMIEFAQTRYTADASGALGWSVVRAASR